MLSRAVKRIVSLLASATEIVCELGLADALVGISHECDHPPEILDRPRLSRPRFDPAGMTSGEIDRAVRRALAEHGGVYAIDGDALAALAPDLILTQAVCEVCAVPTPGVREAVRERGIAAEVLSLDAHTLDEVLDSIEAVGRAAGAAERGRAARRRLAARIAAAGEAVAAVGGVPRRVLALEWLDPPFVPGHWLPEMIAAAGGVCLAGGAGPAAGPAAGAGERSREVSWEELAGLDPDVLIVMPCGYGLAAAAADADRHADRLQAVAPRAIAEGRAFAADGSAYFNRSGPRVADGVEILAGLLHPDRAGPPPPGGVRRWTPPGASAST
jgi:iron complex transport system substrate-binding protein